jgi:FHA domain-containing protein
LHDLVRLLRFVACHRSAGRFEVRGGEPNAGAEILRQWDLGSKNGTWVAGERTHGAVPLTDGASVRLGSETVRFEVTIDERPTKTATVP